MDPSLNATAGRNAALMEFNSETRCRESLVEFNPAEKNNKGKSTSWRKSSRRVFPSRAPACLLTQPWRRKKKKIKTKWNRRGVEIIATLAQLTVRARTRFRSVCSEVTAQRPREVGGFAGPPRKWTEAKSRGCVEEKIKRTDGERVAGNAGERGSRPASRKRKPSDDTLCEAKSRARKIKKKWEKRWERRPRAARFDSNVEGARKRALGGPPTCLAAR